MVLASDAKPLYKSEQVEAWWDVPVYADHWEVRANRVDARVVNHESKKVMTIEMSCPRISNRGKKSEEKTMKYVPLRWELKEQYNRVWKGIYGIRDLTLKRCGIWENAKYLDGIPGFDCSPGSGIHQKLGTGCGIFLPVCLS